jgi:hypothetical protein
LVIAWVFTIVAFFISLIDWSVSYMKALRECLQEWTVKERLALELVLGMLVLAEPSDHDYEPVDEIREGIDFGHDEVPLPDSWVVSTSKKN